ncbi:hypothetical protein DL93DRAFT_1473180 [Clavulina sp. PMI_390]|nr:hypothetical protein DL93DRAFT_1473180 [Clavulina sp. PMI_390]
MHYTRVHIKEIRSFTHIIDRLRTELSWGALIPDHLHTSSQSSSYSAIREPCMMLASALSNSIALLEDTFTYAYDIKDWPPRPPATPGILADDGKVDPNFLVSAYSPAQSELANTVRLLKLQIGTIHASLDRRHSKSQGSTLFDGSDLYDDPNSMDEASKEVFSISVFTVSLLQLAADLNTALRVGKRIATKLATVRRRRLWFPKLSREWFRSHPTVAAYDRGDFDLEQFEEDDPKRSTEVEQVEGIAEEEEDLDDTTPPVSALPISLSQGSSAGQLSAHSSADLPQQKSITLLERFRRLRQSSYRRVRRIWASLIMPRRTLSKAIYRVKHSRHLQYALKNAFGIALLSLPAFLPLNQGGQLLYTRH